MFHKNCNGKIVLDLSSVYVLRSPSIEITPKGIFPGMIQIESTDKKANASLQCTCGTIFSDKDDFEEFLTEACIICHDIFPPSKIRVTDYITHICDDCISGRNSGKVSPNSSGGRLLAAYGQILNKIEAPTLLTILLKKI